jgi:hypothetical protein
MSEHAAPAFIRRVQKALPPTLHTRTPTEYIYLSPWLLIRKDCSKSSDTFRWIKEKLALSSWRIFRDLYLRKPLQVALHTSVEYIFIKSRSVRFFSLDNGRSHKVITNASEQDLSLLKNDLYWRKDFSECVKTVPLIRHSTHEIVEEITDGQRLLEQEFVRKELYIYALLKTTLSIARRHPCALENHPGVKGCIGHGDFQIHNLFWEPHSKEFIVIDWEKTGKYPMLWDSYLFFIMLLNKNKIKISPFLMKMFEKNAKKYFEIYKNELSFDSQEVEKQISACEALYEKMNYNRKIKEFESKKAMIMRKVILDE